MMLLRAVLVALIVPPLWLTMHLLTVGVPLNAPPAPWRQAILRPMLRFWADVLMWLGFGFWGWRVKGAARIALLHCMGCAVPMCLTFRLWRGALICVGRRCWGCQA